MVTVPSPDAWDSKIRAIANCAPREAPGADLLYADLDFAVRALPISP
jgi:hypothetical protein